MLLDSRIVEPISEHPRRSFVPRRILTIPEWNSNLQAGLANYEQNTSCIQDLIKQTFPWVMP
jgi:hypothetical protein